MELFLHAPIKWHKERARKWRDQRPAIVKFLHLTHFSRLSANIYASLRRIKPRGAWEERLIEGTPILDSAGSAREAAAALCKALYFSTEGEERKEVYVIENSVLT